jgi:hypothetical protein
MRHHGLPTRLLDWSVNIMTAAYFAVSDHKQANPPSGVIWALAPALLNQHFFGQQTIFPMDQPPLTDPPDQPGLLEIVFPSVTIARPRPDKANLKSTIAAVLPPEIDPKMMLQQSAFTLHGDVLPLELASKHTDYLLEFAIPGPAKANLAQELHAVGIRQSMLFPDLTSLAACIAERVMNGGI